MAWWTDEVAGDDEETPRRKKDGTKEMREEKEKGSDGQDPNAKMEMTG